MGGFQTFHFGSFRFGFRRIVVFSDSAGCLADRNFGYKSKKWWYYAAVCTAGSVLGGMFGYLIGWGFYEAIGQKIVDIYNLQATVDAIGLKYSANAFLTVFTAAFTPIPYKLITITAGLFQISFCN